LSDLLNATAGEVSTVFEEIHSDDDLRQIRLKYVTKGETAFANLEDELSGAKDYAITIRRMHREPWEPQFVSVIDCRFDKVFRSYFSKWHELAHLLTLTPSKTPRNVSWTRSPAKWDSFENFYHTTSAMISHSR
jgi:hypothetical protein